MGHLERIHHQFSLGARRANHGAQMFVIVTFQALEVVHRVLQLVDTLQRELPPVHKLLGGLPREVGHVVEVEPGQVDRTDHG